MESLLCPRGGYGRPNYLGAAHRSPVISRVLCSPVRSDILGSLHDSLGAEIYLRRRIVTCTLGDGSIRALLVLLNDWIEEMAYESAYFKTDELEDVDREESRLE